MLKFTMSRASQLPQFIWGGGHTVDTDPTRKGWRCRFPWDTTDDVVMVGRRNTVGCATLRHMGARGWDVAIYESATPEEIIAAGNGAGFDPLYVEVGDYPGFGLKVIELIEREVRRMRECEQDVPC